MLGVIGSSIYCESKSCELQETPNCPYCLFAFIRNVHMNYLNDWDCMYVIVADWDCMLEAFDVFGHVNAAVKPYYIVHAPLR